MIPRLIIPLFTLICTAGAMAEPWSFTVAGDMRRYVVYDGIHGWDECVQEIAAAGPGEFLICPGDLDQQYTSNPPSLVYDVLASEFGPAYPFFPGVGNHEVGHPATFDWIRGFDHGGVAYDVTPGPPGCENTTYSWNHGPAHFVMLNLCWDGVTDDGAENGTWHPTTAAWLEADLSANTRPLVFVCGHFPGYPQPDRDTGYQGHLNDTDFNAAENGAHRDGLWDVMRRHAVTAYICGHTHSSSVVQVEGIWQVDFGHARGPRNPTYHGPSTFQRYVINDFLGVEVETWRQPYTEGVGAEAPYTLWHRDTLRLDDIVAETPPTLGHDALRAWPNPFNPSVTVELTLAVPSSGPVTVHDARGRRVAVLEAAVLPAGRNLFQWDGRDAQGRTLPSGPYYVSVAAGQRLTHALVLSR